MSVDPAVVLDLPSSDVREVEARDLTDRELLEDLGAKVDVLIALITQGVNQLAMVQQIVNEGSFMKLLLGRMGKSDG